MEYIRPYVTALGKEQSTQQLTFVFSVSYVIDLTVIVAFTAIS